MAMNKRETAEMQALRDRVAFLEAQMPQDKLEAPSTMTREEKPYGVLTRGWFINSWSLRQDASMSGAVELGCTDGIFHSRSNPNKTSTQTTGSMYRSRLDALIALKVEVSKHFFTAIGKLDTEIRKEKKSPTPTPERGPK